IADVWRVEYADGSRVVAKLIGDAPDSVFPLEAEGLRVLEATGTVTVPRVEHVDPRLLLLEPLPPRDDTPEAWECFAEDLAALHRGTVHDRFGWDHDNWRGKI